MRCTFYGKENLEIFVVAALEAVKVLDCKSVRIFACSSTHEQSNKRPGMRLKTESETYATLYRFLY